MVIQQSQGITTTGSQGLQRAFKIHLPKIVGGRMFEALPRTLCAGMLGIKLTVTTQDLGNGTWSW